MTPVSPRSRFGLVFRRIARVFPNLPIALIGLTACVAELITLGSVPHNAYTSGPAVAGFAVCFIVWFWLTASWCSYWMLQCVDGVAERHGRWLGCVLRWCLGFVAVSFLMQHVLSWGLYLRAGRFANIDAMVFVARNPFQTVWLDLAPGERLALRIVLGLGIGLLPVTYALMPRLARSTWRDRTPPLPFSSPYMVWGFLAAGVVCIWTSIERDQSVQRRAPRLDAIANYINPSMTLACSGISQLWTDPITPCLRPDDLQALGAWQPPQNPDARKPSIILIAVESLRADVVFQTHQGREVTPHLNRLTKNGLQWKHAYAQSTHSDYSDVCIVSSLYPLRTQHHHYYRRSDPWPKTLAFDVFSQAGYRTAIISSQNESWGGMDQFLETPRLDLFYDSQRSGAKEMSYLSTRDSGFAQEFELGAFSAGRLYDWHTMDRAIEWVSDSVRDGSPFFLSMNFQASHFPYELPEDADQPFQPCHLDHDVSFLWHPPEKTPMVRNAYLNGIHYCDRQIGRMIGALEQLGQLDDVIFVVVGENGEAFHENGSVGHACEPVEPVIHTAAVMHAPNLITPAVEDYPMELVDLLPTLFGLLDWPAHPNFQGIDALAANRPPLEERLLFFHVNSPNAEADAVQWAGRWKYTIDHRTGLGKLCDLAKDPGEGRDLSQSQPVIAEQLREVLTRWRCRQLAYYHYPMYYASHYPPAAPKLIIEADPDRCIGDSAVSAMNDHSVR